MVKRTYAELEQLVDLQAVRIRELKAEKQALTTALVAVSSGKAAHAERAQTTERAPTEHTEHTEQTETEEKSAKKKKGTPKPPKEENCEEGEKKKQKRTKNKFQFYCDAMRSTIAAECGSLAEQTTRLGEMWKELSEAQKQPYVLLAEEAKAQAKVVD